MMLDCFRRGKGKLLIPKSLPTDGLNCMNVIWASTKTGRERFVLMSATVEQLLEQHTALMEAGDP